MIKPADDILITPNCSLIPKVIEIYPPFDPKGYDQDSPIRITFNKAVNPDDFYNFKPPPKEKIMIERQSERISTLNEMIKEEKKKKKKKYI